MNQGNALPRDAQELDIMEYIVKLWKKRFMLIKWCCVGAVIGLVVGFSLPETYKAGVTLALETNKTTPANVGGIASMMGVNLNNSADAIGIEMLPDIARSVPFVVGLFDIPVQFERKDEVIDTTLLDYILNYQRKPWWSYIVKFPMKALGWCISLVKEKEEDEGVQNAASRSYIDLTKKERAVVKYIGENFLISVDKKTGKTVVEMEMQDPLVVYTVVQTVVEHLTAYMADYRTSKVRQDVENLTTIYAERKADYYAAQQTYARYIDANKNVVLQSAQAERERLQQEMNLAYQVYSQVATRLEAARIKEQETMPVFVILEPAVIPNLKSSPSKAKLLVLYVFLAACCAGGWVLFGDDIKGIVKDVTKED